MIKILDWDTKFFGFGVARLESHDIDESQLIHELHQLKNDGIRLVYCICHDEALGHTASKFGRLVDRKATFHKKFDGEPAYPHNVLIEEYTSEEPTEDLYNLAIQSGLCSRFNVDSGLPNDKFVELYKTWIRNSTKKKIAFKVLVAKNSEHLIGMVTLGEKDGRADIGLIAVDSKYRGQGIGNALMYQAENEFLKQFSEGQVVTQKDNIAACRLYEKCGYAIEKIEHIYHIWLNENNSEVPT